MAMDSLNSVLLLLQILIIFAHLAISQTTDYGYNQCRNTANFTTNSTYQQTLEIALDSLPSNAASNGGFYHTSAGNRTDKRVNALALCRGYIAPEACQDCVKNAIPLLRRNCPNEKEAVAWYSNCMVRYSNREILGVFEDWASGNVTSSAHVSDVDEFNKVLRNLMTRLQAEAAGGNSVRKYAAGNVSFEPDSFTIYAIMQCTPDLSREQCSRCLDGTMERIDDCCNASISARVFDLNCFLRYSNERFYEDPPLLSAPSGKKSNKSRIIYIAVAVTCVFLGLIGIVVWLLFTKRRQQHNDSKIETSTSFSTLLIEGKSKQISSTANTEGIEITTVQTLQYGLGTIKEVTNDFSPKNKIGKGGFGLVYKGVLPNGQEVAVKRLSETSSQGVEQFVNEAILVAKLQHRNLVRLVGFCHEAKEKILIYEYVPNKSLDYFLFDSVKHGHLDWTTRWKIIGGITRGMLYLHEDSRLRIIHRDLKASNILLDQDMNAKISDFGLARIFGVDQTLGNTKKIAGTLGYMSPEYAMHGHFSVKSDVFSFGVIVLEIVSGRRNSSFYEQDEVEDLLLFAWKQWTGGKPLALLDPTLGESYSKNEVIRCINIGLLCVQEDADARPSMASILNMLNNYSITLPSPRKPPYFLSKGLYLDVSGDGEKSIVTGSEMHPR